MEIRSVQGYLSIIENLQEKYTYSTSIHSLMPAQLHRPKFIYRGHGNENYQLLPGIFRWHEKENGTSVSEYSQMEHNILQDFIGEACRYIKDVSTEDIHAWLEIAQHFSVPTRLLDFTENPLVALYFACADINETNAAIWIVNEAEYNRVMFDIHCLPDASYSEEIISKIIFDEVTHQDYGVHDAPQFIQFPWIYKPCYREERMNFQSSIFMLWGARREALTNFISSEYYMTADTEKGKCDQQFGVICKITIPASAKGNIIKQLDSCGINEKFIYPGLDGVGRYIKKKYSSALNRESGV